jgi:hypothetical protein
MDGNEGGHPCFSALHVKKLIIFSFHAENSPMRYLSASGRRAVSCIIP